MNKEIENPGFAAITVGCIGLAAVGIIMLLLSITMRAVLVYYYFDWFITPATEWQLQGFIHAAGFASAWYYINNGFKMDEELTKKIEGKETNEQLKILGGHLGKVFMMFGSSLVFGALFHLWM